MFQVKKEKHYNSSQIIQIQYIQLNNNQLFSMGDSPSKQDPVPQRGPPKNFNNNTTPPINTIQRPPVIQQDPEDIYILQDLSSITLKAKKKQKYFWIDPKIFNSQNQKYESFLKKSVDLEGCSSIQGLQNQMNECETHKKFKIVCAASLKDQQYKKLEQNSLISTIYLFCQNQQRAKLLMSNFPKIKSAKFDIVQLRDFLLQQEETDQGLDPKINILFTIQQDTNLMNKYRINFHSLTSGISKVKAKSDFINFARKFYPDHANQINQFQSRYRVNLAGKQGALQAIQWLSKPGFFWESTQTLPKITTDPKKLAYLRFPFKQCYEGILKNYKSNPSYLSEVFMVITPTQQQLYKIKSNVQNFFIFTTFAKGYTSQKKAKQAAKKQPRALLVRAMMKLPPKIQQNLDFGYSVIPNLQEGPDVLFNIYNVFQIIQFEQQLKQMTIQYGSLAQVAYIREKQRGTRLSPFQQNLLRNYDYLQDITSRINSQATILQMSGYFQDSLQIYNQKLQIIRKSQPSQQTLDRHTIQLGDAYRINQQYKKAEQQYESITDGRMALIAKVHLAQLYFKTKQTAKLSKVIAQIEQNLNKYKQISEPASFKAQNYIGMQLMNRGKYKEASKLFKALAKQINAYYDFKFQGIPLVHEICRNRAACETKLNNFNEALNLLDSTKSWQKVCEGNKSPGLIITENLIRSVHESRGEPQQVKQCENQIQRIKKSAAVEQNLYLSRSGVFINLDESIINIQTTPNNTGGKKQANITNSPQRRNIDQSAININI